MLFSCELYPSSKILKKELNFSNENFDKNDFDNLIRLKKMIRHIHIPL